MYLLGFDLGTTGCKASIFNEGGELLGGAYRDCDLHIKSDKVIEQDADVWWKLFCQTVSESIKNAGIAAGEIGSVSISSQGISFVPVDSDLNPLMNAICWLDSRAEAEADEMLATISQDEFFAITGKRAEVIYVLPKILWIRNNLPEIYKKTYKFLMAHDYIVARLTGKCLTDHTLASGTLLYDINKTAWSEEITGRFGISTDLLPEIRWSGTPVEAIRKDVVKGLGLSENLSVCIGAQDQKAAARGVDLQIDEACLSIGTAGAIEFIVGNPVIDEKKRLPCFTYAEQGLWVLEAVIGTAGAALKWLRDTLFPVADYKYLDDLCRQSAAGANGLCFFPHLAGAGSPHWNSRSQGVFYGLTLNTSQSDIVRAVFEGIAFQFKANTDVASELGVRTNILKIAGGGTKSKIWREIISAISDISITAYESSDMACLGAAEFAASGAGVYSPAFSANVLAKHEIIRPDKQMADKYREIYGYYASVQNSMLQI